MKVGLGRTTPCLPAHGGGLPGPLSVVLSDIDRKGSIQVIGADTKKFVSRVVVNTKNVWDRKETSLQVDLVTVKPQYRTDIPLSDTLDYKVTANLHDISDFKLVSQSLKPGLIATNARQRLLEVVPGHLKPETAPIDLESNRSATLKPFSTRDIYDHTLLTDYEQAAHDARRMGWLLQDPGAEGKSDIVLRLPTRWHTEYLKAFLKPRDIDKKYETMSLDHYLKDVIANFRPSALFQSLLEGDPPRRCKNGPIKLREAIYDCEFNFSSNALAGPLFLLPQVRTEDGKGTVDFVCKRRKWVIEVMRERSDIKGHIARFKNCGAYHKEWPNYEWRVVDFCLDDESASDAEPGKPSTSQRSSSIHILLDCVETEENYRLVNVVPRLDHRCLDVTIVAIKKSDEVFTCLG